MNNPLFDVQLRRWMEQNGYREGTIRLTLRQTKQVFAAFDAGDRVLPHKATHVSLRRFVQFASKVGKLEAFVKWLATHDIVAAEIAPKRAPKRQLEAKAFSDADYRTLLKACTESPEHEAIVLEVMLSTGLRVGDILRVRTEDLEQAVQKEKGEGLMPLERKGGEWVNVPIGGALDAWRRLTDAVTEEETDNVAELITQGESSSAEAGDAAYTRMDRYLKRMGTMLEITGRIHLHRLRRTVAVRALEASGQDLVSVQHMLIHKNITTTQRYVDEINVKRVAKLQQAVRA